MGLKPSREIPDDQCRTAFDNQRPFDLQPETFFTSDIGKRISLTKTPDEDDVRQAVQLNDTYYIEANIDNVGKFDRIKQALTIFGFEDELSIKYAD